MSRLLRDERKNPDPDVVRRICDIVGAPFEWNYYGRGPDPHAPPEAPLDAYPNRPVAIALARRHVGQKAIDEARGLGADRLRIRCTDPVLS